MTDTTTTPASTLAERIAHASIDVGAFVPDKRNKEQNYDYISADAVLARGGHALAINGVAVIPSVSDVEVNATQYTTRSGNVSTRYDARVHFVMTVVCADQPGHDMNISWWGFGSDYSVPDKAYFKAVTSGHKYFLMKLLNIGAGNEDGEHENPPNESAERVSSAPANRAREQAQPATPPATMNERADKAESAAIRAYFTNSGAERDDVESFFGGVTVKHVRDWARANRKTIAESLAAFTAFVKQNTPPLPPGELDTDETPF